MNTYPTLQRLRSAREAAAYYGVSTSTLWRWVQQGLIPEPIRIGGRTFWEPEALQQHTAKLAAQRTGN
ncbi:helix-turn-helix transcriptional regulator [Paracoccus sp. P2]|uniref:helix-turn-helix transcriptional regulator n=1 Tax=Paracoccus sp. P2 TaxID=3248840 RepID=UPI00391F5620